MATSNPPDQPTETNLEFVVSVSGAQVAEINAALMARASSDWQPLGGVIAAARMDTPSVLPTIPDVFFARQLRVLVSQGDLEGKGDLRDLNSGAVRRRSSVTNEA
jgi:hypothetical protein